MAEPDISDVKRRMDGALESLRKEFAGLRTGRASASLLEPVTVDAYGSHMPLTQVGTMVIGCCWVMTTLGDLGDDPGNFPAPFVWVAGIRSFIDELLANREFIESKVTEAATEVEEFPRSLALGGIAPLADHQADLIGFGDLVVVAGSGNCLSQPLQSI